MTAHQVYGIQDDTPPPQTPEREAPMWPWAASILAALLAFLFLLRLRDVERRS